MVCAILVPKFKLLKNCNVIFVCKQYRLDTYLSPDDLIITPRSLGSVKQQLRDCQEKMDRHKQLVDRYLVTDKGLSPEEQQGKFDSVTLFLFSGGFVFFSFKGFCSFIALSD